MYQILDNPIIYRISQAVFAPGAHELIPRHLRALYRQLPRVDGEAGLLLDAGCGPWSWLSTLGLHPVGLDLNPTYMRQYASIGEFMRVCKPGGYVVVVDVVWPRSNLRRPWAAMVRAIDRGRFSRRQDRF